MYETTDLVSSPRLNSRAFQPRSELDSFSRLILAGAIIYHRPGYHRLDSFIEIGEVAAKGSDDRAVPSADRSDRRLISGMHYS